MSLIYVYVCTCVCDKNNSHPVNKLSRLTVFLDRSFTTIHPRYRQAAAQANGVNPKVNHDTDAKTVIFVLVCTQKRHAKERNSDVKRWP